MYTYCPNCAAVFELTATQLSLAAGKVRCGECRHVYIATDYLYDDLDAACAALDEETGSNDKEPKEAPVDYVMASDTAEEIEPEIPPSMTRQPGSWEQRPFSVRDLSSVAGIICLLVLLGFQYVWFNRNELAANDGWRPTLGQFCEMFGCVLPLRVDTAQLAIISRDVRQHPTAEGALLINAAFENRADFVQPYPVFEISFTDNAGGPVAHRRFFPAEYLQAGEVEGGLQPFSPVQAVLEVMDPGDRAVSFQFEFL